MYINCISTVYHHHCISSSLHLVLSSTLGPQLNLRTPKLHKKYLDDASVSRKDLHPDKQGNICRSRPLSSFFYLKRQVHKRKDMTIDQICMMIQAELLDEQVLPKPHVPWKKRTFEVNWTPVQEQVAHGLFGSSDMQSIEDDSDRAKHNIKRTCTGHLQC